MMGFPDKARLMAFGMPGEASAIMEDQICGVGGAVPPSAGGISMNLDGRIFAFGGSAGNGADTTEDTLSTFSLPANAFNAVGRSVWIYAWGTYANNANTKAAKLYFGSESQAAATGQNVSWSIEMMVLKSAANVQQISGQSISGTTHGGVVNQAGAEADTAAIAIKVTGQNSSSATANSVILNGLIVNFMN